MTTDVQLAILESALSNIGAKVDVSIWQIPASDIPLGYELHEYNGTAWYEKETPNGSISIFPTDA